MVTAEFAVALAATVVVMMTLCWGMFLVVVQLRLIDTAGEVARQAARGDRAGIVRVEAQAPAGTRVSTRVTSQRSQVQVRLRTRPFAGLPAISLGAAAEVPTEPGLVRP